MPHSSTQSEIADQQEYLQLADGPLDNPKTVVKQVLASDFAATQGMQRWCNFGIVTYKDADPMLYDYNTNVYKMSSKHFAVLKTRILDNQKKLVLVPGNAGYGAFVKGTIKKGEPLGFYTGFYDLMTEESEHAQSEYNHSLHADLVKSQCSTGINAKKYGNILRFFQHLPGSDSSDMLHLYHFNSKDERQKIATCNISKELYIYQGKPFLNFIAARDLTDEIVGFDYQLEYWQAQDITPLLFYKNGAVVPSARYTLNQITFIYTALDPKTGKPTNTLTTIPYTPSKIRSVCKEPGLIPMHSINETEVKVSTSDILKALDETERKGSYYIRLGLPEERKISPPDTDLREHVLYDFSADGPVQIIPFKPETHKIKGAPEQKIALPIASDSPILSPISQIRGSLERFNNEKTTAFFKAFDLKEYNKALRIACHASAYDIVKILVDNNATLNLNPNEKAGAEQLSAFDRAQDKTRIYQLLSSLCVNQEESNTSKALATS
jgi:hypothetical protein